MTTVVPLSIECLKIDADTQSRLSTNGDTIEDYAEVIANADGEWPFGPIDVFHDGTHYFVADGFHRTMAAMQQNRSSVPCRIHNGTARDAKIFGMTANDSHGLRMSREDKRACVIWLLEHEQQPLHEIAKKAGVGYRTAQRVKASLRSDDAPLAESPSKTRKKVSTPPKEEDPFETTTDSDSVPFDTTTDSDSVPVSTTSAKPEAVPYTPEEDAKRIKNMIQQHIDKAVRLVDDLHRVKPDNASRMAAVRGLQAVKIW